MSTTGERKAKAQRARRELEQVSAALDQMRDSAIQALVGSAPAETDKREDAYRFIGTIDLLRKKLEDVVADGLMAVEEELLEDPDNR